MKKTIYLLLFSFILVACQTEDNKGNDSLAKFEINKLTNSKIAFEDEGKLILNVSDHKILETFKAFNKTMELQLDPERFEIIKVEDKNYLRFFSKNNQVSTIALEKGSDNIYRTGSTVCTSTACASGGGCIPNGNYCTKCRPEGTPPKAPDGDCRRTTTGEDSIK
ncbi:hypothetical protein [Polaribacter cellanae]|uniref:Lipoprotein n=1 Tax=Polaribacter cellanae TaxID=2818493 RepID=A0A975H5R2_9FLAO|nr:hypothetical protein [Polaribacter cellanae]QTE21676.1 hypothetical protein J3359_12705 [Polaribacter cellanae]